MNFRFAHYDPPPAKKKKPPATTIAAAATKKPSVSTNSKANVEGKPAGKPKSRGKAKVVNRPSAQTGTTKATRRVGLAKGKHFESNENDDGGKMLTEMSPPKLEQQSSSTILDDSSPTTSTTLSSEERSSGSPPDTSQYVDTIISKYLGQGRLDPFQLWPVDYVPLEVQVALDHGKQHFSAQHTCRSL